MLGSLFVKEEQRHVGIGTKLTNAFEKWIAKNFGEDYVLEVTAINNNLCAFKFYKKMGFEPVRTIFRKKK